MSESEKIGWFIVEDTGQSLEENTSHEAFELNKADSQALVNFGAWLDVLAAKAMRWSTSTLRFLEGPDDLVKIVREFPGKVRKPAGAIPSEGGEADADAPFPKTLSEAIKWGDRAAKAVAETEQKGLVSAIIEAVKEFKKTEKILDSLEDLEDKSTPG